MRRYNSRESPTRRQHPPHNGGHHEDARHRMDHRSISFLQLAALSFAAPARERGIDNPRPPRSGGPYTVRVPLKGERMLRALVERDFDILAKTKDGQVDVVAENDEDLRFLQTLGVPIAVIRTPDMPSRRAPALDANLGLYHTYAEMTSAPSNARTDVSGARRPLLHRPQLLEGRYIYALKISDNVSIDEDEPEVLYMGNHHAREIMSVDIPLRFAQYLLANYGTDPDVTAMVNEREIYFVPMVNPDGHVYVELNHSGDSDYWWRKNRRRNYDGSYGVDLNRNYGYMWGYDNIGSSPMPSDDDVPRHRALSRRGKHRRSGRSARGGSSSSDSLSIRTASGFSIRGDTPRRSAPITPSSRRSPTLRRRQRVHRGSRGGDSLRDERRHGRLGLRGDHGETPDVSLHARDEQLRAGRVRPRGHVHPAHVRSHAPDEHGSSPLRRQSVADHAALPGDAVRDRRRGVSAVHGELGADPSPDPNPAVSYDVIEYKNPGWIARDGANEVSESLDLRRVRASPPRGNTRGRGAISRARREQLDAHAPDGELLQRHDGHRLASLPLVVRHRDQLRLRVRRGEHERRGARGRRSPGTSRRPTTRTALNKGNGITGTSPGWMPAIFPLTAYLGSDIEIRFSYVTDPGDTR